MSSVEGRGGASPATSVEKFLDLLESTQLIDSAALRALRQTYTGQRLADDAQGLARDLVARNVLTKHQAALLYQNKLKGLFIGPYKVLDRIGSGGMGIIVTRPAA